MKKYYYLLAILLTLNYVAFGQSATEPNSQFKYGMNLSFKYGFGEITETGNVLLNGFVNSADLFISARILNDSSETTFIYILTGWSGFEFNGNRTVNGNTTNLKNIYWQIPLKGRFDFNVFENKATNQNVYLTLGAGFYTNTLLIQQTETISSTDSETNLGWNFGVSVQLGAKFNLSKKLNLGIGYENQKDLSKMSKNGIDRKIVNADLFYFGLEYRLK